MKPGRLKFAVRLLISAALIGWLATRLEWAALGARLRDIDARWLWPAAVLSPLCVLLLALRWGLFLRARGLFPPFRGLVRLMWGGQFFNTFLPGAVGGDIFKAVAVGKLLPGHSIEAGATVIVDRFCALVTLAVLAGIGVVEQRDFLVSIFARGVALPRWLWLAVIALGLGVGIAGWWLQRRSPQREIWRQRLRAAGGSLWLGLTQWRTFLFASVVSLAIHTANFTIFFVLARALRIEIGFGQVLLLMPVLLLVAMLPISINGHGIREVLLIGYFSGQGITAPGVGPADAAVAVSLLYVTNDLLWNLPGGLWLAWEKYFRSAGSSA